MMKATELLYIDDFDLIVDIGHSMQQECEPNLEFSELEVRSNCFAVVNDLIRETVNCWIVKDNDKIIAFGVGRIGKYMFSSDKIASMVLWYVRPEYRRTRAAFEIMHNFENWAKINQCKRIELGAAKVGVDDAVRINRMFDKRGFRPYGELFFREIN